MEERKGKKIQVVIVALAPQRQTLLLQTNKRRGEFWQNVTGSVEQDESYAVAAKREFQEETQLNATSLRQLPLTFQFYHELRKTHYTEQCFVALLNTSSPPQLDPQEHQDFKWIPVEEITSHHYQYPSNFEAYEKAMESLTTLSP